MNTESGANARGSAGSGLRESPVWRRQSNSADKSFEFELQPLGATSRHIIQERRGATTSVAKPSFRRDRSTLSVRLSPSSLLVFAPCLQFLVLVHSPHSHGIRTSRITCSRADTETNPPLKSPGIERKSEGYRLSVGFAYVRSTLD